MAEDEKKLQPDTDTQPSAPTAPEQPAAKQEKDTKQEKEKPAKPDKKQEKKTAELEEKLAKAQKEADAAKETLLRTAAEYDNYRKRSAKEHDAAFGNGLSHAVLTLLPVIDTLEMAAKATTEDENYKKGVMMTLDKCAEALKKLGVEEIPAEGVQFDPEVHAAVMQQAVQGAESGTITMVLQKGYQLKDKIIRHASVAVAE